MVRAIIGMVFGFVLLVGGYIFVPTGIVYGLNAASIKLSPNMESLAVLAITILAVALAAIVAGFACKLIAGGGHAHLVFAGLVLLICLLALVVPVLRLTTEAVKEHSEDEQRSIINMISTVNNAQSTLWFAILITILASGGILLGASLRRHNTKLSSDW